jgi:hypothetical protein
MRVQARYINTKDNILADHLNRGDLRAFRRAYKIWLAMDAMDKDREDWMLKSSEVATIDQEVGPFDIAACCDNRGKNAHLCTFSTEEMDCRLQD